MKKYLIIFAMLLCIGYAEAQLIKSKAGIDPKYLTETAVPEVNGKVVFSRSIAIANGIDHDQAYQKVMSWVSQFYNRQEVLSRKDNGSANPTVRIAINEYLTFKKAFFNLDRTQLIYCLDIKVNGNALEVKMYDIKYYYDEDREGKHLTAEEQITDRNAVNKKRNGFYKGYGKFRTGTIDTFEHICTSLEKAL
ncbi:MAG: DUF4468 domain-containing protein [Bacteroidales bacterium]|nr:DUF4468 domain-containing protein [Candidatus Liminaster caballi]